MRLDPADLLRLSGWQHSITGMTRSIGDSDAFRVNLPGCRSLLFRFRSVGSSHLATVGIYESTTKTGNTRYIPLPQETIDLLHRYRAVQDDLRQTMGDRWQESDYVFTREDGSPVRPDCITQWLNKFSRRHGLPHINPHAFRHTAASVLISQGSDIVTVSKMLGHAKVSTTEDIYSHVIEESKQLASNLLADVFFR